MSKCTEKLELAILKLFETGTYKHLTVEHIRKKMLDII